MNRIPFYSIAVYLFAAFSLNVSALAQSNLLLNPGFQLGPDGTTNASPSALHWQAWGETSRENWGSHDADGWLATMHGWYGTNFSGWYQDVPATGGLWYILSGYFYAETNYVYSSIELKLEFLDAGMGMIAAHTTRVTGVTNAWTYYEVEGNAPSNAAWARAVAAATGQGTTGVLLMDNFELTSRARPTRAKLEPARGVLTGVNLDWGSQYAGQFNGMVGWDHVIFVDFTYFPSASGYGHLDSHVGQVREAQGIYMITLEPMGGLETVNASNCAVFAGWCAWWNAQGVPIMVRFAHEMNGDWYPWRMRPQLYREKFRLMAQTIRSIATNTVMIWAPNEATGYPFSTFIGMTRATYTNGYGTLADWVLLDSNGDGVLNNPGVLNDDPYSPFYPGDQYVDWVGMTLYHWGQVYPWWYNCTPEARKFAHNLTGNYNGPNGGDLTWLPDFYADWAEGRGKPLIIAETAAYFRPGAPNPPNPAWPPGQTTNEFEIKRLWLDQVYNIHGDTTNALDISVHFPRIKAINWFNWYKIEAEAQNSYVNWTVTSNPAVRAEYLNRLRAAQGNQRYFLHASDLRGLVYGWNYSFDGWATGGPPFAVSLSTNSPYEGSKCLRVDYTAPTWPYGVTVACDLAAMSDPWTPWSSNNAIYLRVKVMPGTDWTSVRLIFQSAESSWNPLATTSCPPDGAWHTLIFPYNWSLHDSSAWLNIFLNLDVPTNANATIYLDAFEVVTDTDLDGLPLGADPDDDGDGMADDWETAYGLNPRDPTDASLDPDLDGASNLSEFIANTNPLDPTSFLRISATSATGGVWSIRWLGQTGVQYRVFATDQLQTGGWSAVWGPSNGYGGLLEYSSPFTATTRFFRVGAGRIGWPP
ncbi:MAG: glycoside hydrolase family 26 protein [Kiritimatiellae bacterium]|nr:glycoside hydrolase family 26 protein [Kiritimatiellia bacterium]MDW8457577.1 glycosyl hydrolase [Verrucomicrobiota bacterium]